MKLRCVAVVAALAMASVTVAQEPELKTSRQKVSYGFGINVGRSMLKDGLVKEDLDMELLIQGLRDAINEKQIKITEKEFQDAFNASIAPKLEERQKAAAAKWDKDNTAFLAANKLKKGVKTTASGLQYRVLKSGDGKTPKATDKVRTQYVGKLHDGTVFDQSEQPIEFQVNKVIKGWTEALQLMKEGDKFELVIPAELGYGEDGFAPAIPGNSTLLFEVELIEVVPATAAPKPAPKR